MEPSVLVAYATRQGSSEEVARFIAEAMRESGRNVDVQAAAKISSVEQYRAVVLVAPLYMFRLLKDARRFLSRHRTALEKLPVALFVLGPVEESEKDWTGARQQLDKELKQFPWLSPIAQHIVGGKFDPAALGFPFNLIPALRRMPASDIRDWTAIHALASNFGKKLQPARP